MVIIVSNMLRIEALLEEDGGGSTAAVGSTYASAKGSLEGGRDAPVEDSTQGHLKIAFI